MSAIAMTNAIAIIPARGGSRRIPRKNIRPFFGKPIIAYSIEVARDCGIFDKVVVSTEDEEIAEIAIKHGAHVLIRPKYLAQDEIGTQEVMTHAMNAYPTYDLACCIYPTAPMLAIEDIEHGHAILFMGLGLDYAMSVNAEPLYDAGQFYWGHSRAFFHRAPLIGPRTAMIPIDKDRVCDINTNEDWVRAELMYAAWRKETA